MVPVFSRQTACACLNDKCAGALAFGSLCETRTHGLHIISVAHAYRPCSKAIGVMLGDRTQLAGFTTQSRNRFDLQHHDSSCLRTHTRYVQSFGTDSRHRTSNMSTFKAWRLYQFVQVGIGWKEGLPTFKGRRDWC